MGTRWSVLGVVFAVAGGIGCTEETQCGATTASGACLQVMSIVPTYEGGKTDSVDVVQNNCMPSTGTNPVAFPEPFADHEADITIANSQREKNSIHAPGVVLQNFTIKYSVIGCPAGGKCPALDDVMIDPGQTVSIDSGSSVTFTLPLMPVRKKMEFIAKGGDATKFPAYSAQYIMTGPTDPDAKETLVGYTSFTIGSYDYCPTGSYGVN